MTEEQGDLILEALDVVKFLLHVGVFAICFSAGMKSAGLILRAMGRKSFMSLLVVCVLAGSGEARAQTRKYGRVAEVTISGATGSVAFANGTFECWEDLVKGAHYSSGSVTYVFAGYVESNWCEMYVTVDRNSGSVRVEFNRSVHGASLTEIWDGIRTQASAFTLPVTITYSAKHADMPATVELDLKEEPSGAAATVDFGDDPASDPDSPLMPDQPNLMTEPEISYPSYELQMPTSDLSEPELGLPHYPENFFFDEFPIAVNTPFFSSQQWLMPMHPVLQSHGVYNISLNSHPIGYFPTGPFSGMFTQFHNMAQSFRLVLVLVAFFIFFRAIYRTVVFA